MNNDMTENNQIEKIARLEANLSNLENIVKTGFIDVKVDLKDIKDSLLSRVERVEISKVSYDAFMAYKEEMASYIQRTDNRLDKLEATQKNQQTFIDNLTGKWAILAILGGILIVVVTSTLTTIVTRNLNSSSCINNCVNK